MTTKVAYPILKLVVESIHMRAGFTTVTFMLTEADPFDQIESPYSLDIGDYERDQFPDFKIGEHYIFRRIIEAVHP